MALPLLPKERVLEGFNLLKKQAQKYKDLRQFVGYFEHQWFKVFKPELWCIGCTTFRTNNATECKYMFNCPRIRLLNFNQEKKFIYKNN